MSATLPFERRRLGRSELTIPRTPRGKLGIDHFDTADAYGGGRSERMIGAWMHSRGVRPMITSKTFNPMDAGGDHGLAPERIIRQLERPLSLAQREEIGRC